MALIPCKNCKKSVSSSAKKCPHCGIQFVTESVLTHSPLTENIQGNSPKLESSSKVTDLTQEKSQSANILEGIGTIIVIIGIVVLIGNITGIFRTFPYAGFITITIGSFISAMSKKS